MTNSDGERRNRPEAGDDLGGPDAGRGAPRIMPATDYHRIKALSAGMVWAMSNDCPLKGWLSSPWNPNREVVNANHFDIGTALHLAVLEAEEFEERTVVHGFDDYRKKEAQLIRDVAWDEDKTPLKPSELAVVNGMRDAILSHPVACDLLQNGEPERSIVWQWDGLPCKARPDYLSDDRRNVLDLKTTTTVNPRVVARKAFNEGWHLRAAWYTAAVASINAGVLPDHYLFVVAETKAPHLVEIFELDERALLLGDRLIQKELPRAAECLRTGVWPSYGNGEITKLVLPSWQMAERFEDLEP